MKLAQLRLSSLCMPLSGALALVLMACAGGDPQPEATVEAPSSHAGIKIPVTTRSGEALDLFLEARTLTDRLRAREARALFLEALEHDRYFALAHLQLAMTSTSAREFFETMERAVALSEVVSEGERLMILAQDADVRGDPAKQLELLQRLVSLYPDDERAHYSLALFHNLRQEYEAAIEHFRIAAALAPGFSSPHNQLGYIYRALGRYEEAEQALVKYIELLPDEPNPYDSYAELLMKVGRFEESIVNYKKALALKPDFFFSIVGIGHDLIFLDRAPEAREVFERMYGQAADVGNKRTAVLWTAISHVYEGDLDAALETSRRLYKLAEANDDPVQMAGDLTLMGRILLAAGEFELATEKFAGSTHLMEIAGVPGDVVENSRRNALYWMTRLEIDRDALDDARAALDTYRQLVENRQIPFQQRRVQELEGAIALRSGDPVSALEALAGANQQAPRVNYLTALAYRDAGDLERARKHADLAAHSNSLQVSYAFVRTAALALLDALED